MSKIALRKLSGSAAAVAAALSIVSLAAEAQEARSAPLGVYLGTAYGIGVNTRPCDGYDKQVTTGCERASTAGKFFAGYRTGSSFSLEYSYYFFKTIKRFKGPGNPAPGLGETYEESYPESAHVQGLGINWEVELLGGYTNHLRTGLARVNYNVGGYKSTVTSTSPTYQYSTTSNQQRTWETMPYIGAGLSNKVCDYARLFTGFDYFINGHHSLIMLGAGMSVDF